MRNELSSLYQFFTRGWAFFFRVARWTENWRRHSNSKYFSISCEHAYLIDLFSTSLWSHSQQTDNVHWPYIFYKFIKVKPLEEYFATSTGPTDDRPGHNPGGWRGQILDLNLPLHWSSALAKYCFDGETSWNPCVVKYLAKLYYVRIG